MSNPSPPATGIALPRLGLLGNPGDGYGGQALATLFSDFSARVSAVEGDGFRILPNPTDGLRFETLGHAVRSFAGGGADDGLRLIRAAVRQFPAVVEESGSRLDSDWESAAVHLSYATDIPRQVGLSGSSALVIATLRALAAYFSVRLDPWALAEGALRAENEDLGITAGPMDRIVQSWGGTVLMDLAPPRSAGGVQIVDTGRLPPLFVLWSATRTKNSGRLHAPLRMRWERGDPEVLAVMDELRGVVDEGMKALATGDIPAFGRCMSVNFDLRARVFPIHDEDRAMVSLVGEQGCPAKLAGSGGAVVGLLADGASPSRLRERARAAGFNFLLPSLDVRTDSN